ncbi:MAG: hypothetical protein IKM96_00600 [Clostridiales bacterium]|jgi:hypothetical protein|nr:hypothetical protein [Clostridiales bacterium]MBQ1743859.1 hypothetical protein [Clostridiales bacterium]MBQ2156374.1 hypothetical protein [Clostridiales bacterium]MBQ5519353.1 hypothetical protein [Clostridiales bacterium]MBR3700217.1 hypothetical protein [Clostridiales bacterium]
MAIVEITVYSISAQLESKLQGKLLKENEIADIHNALSGLKKKQFKSVKILCIVMAVIFVVLTIGSIIAGFDNIGLTIATIVIPLILMGIAGYIAWYINVGKVAKRWNQLLKASYPDIAGKYKL